MEDAEGHPPREKPSDHPCHALRLQYRSAELCHCILHVGENVQGPVASGRPRTVTVGRTQAVEDREVQDNPVSPDNVVCKPAAKERKKETGGSEQVESRILRQVH